jgi:hypothetical protein
MNVQRRLVTETVKVTAAKVTAKADSKESATIVVGKATKLTTAGRKKRTKKSGQSGIREKAASKVGAAATDASKSVKFALTAHKKFLFPETAELLKDKNVWIADTGATVHTTAGVDNGEGGYLSSSSKTVIKHHLKANHAPR